MSWQWVDVEDYQRFLHDELHVSNHALYAHRRLVAELWRGFPTPGDWLQVPPEQRPVIHGGLSGEFQYIVYWAWAQKFCAGNAPEVEERRGDMLAYLHARPKYSMVKMAMALGLLEESDVAYLCGDRDWIANPVARHVFLVGKPMRQFSETDIAWAPKIRPGDTRYGVHTLRDLRFRLDTPPRLAKSPSAQVLTNARTIRGGVRWPGTIGITWCGPWPATIMCVRPALPSNTSSDG